MDLDLKSRTAVVSGASTGIGRAIATMLALEGVRVVGVARRRELLDTLAQEVKAAGGISSSTTPAAAGRCRSTHPTAPGTKPSR
jgi:short-subunit dehydrogenase